MVCSMNSYDPSPTTYKDVITPKDRNYLMYSFCPKTITTECGIPTELGKEKIHTDLLAKEDI